MNIYIKSFNRPFYLERCLHSIQFNVTGSFRIIILDDGTMSKYLLKIRELFPRVEIVTSGADDQKVQLLREGKFKEIRQKYIEPSRFWVQEIEKETGPCFLLLEDDTWFINHIDIDELERMIDKRGTIFCKLWYGPREISGEKYIRDYERLDAFSDIQYIHPLSLPTSYAAWNIWLVCMAVYNREYWLSCFRDIRDMTDEESQLKRAMIEYRKNRSIYAYAKLSRRAVYQGWAITGRSDPLYAELGIRQHIYMDAINELWLNGQINVMNGYPYDFSDDYFLEKLEGVIDQVDIEKWKQWKNGSVFSFNTYYYNDL